jgi:hypothetical protein
LAALALALSSWSIAGADERRAGGLANMAEPLIGESITDIDGDEPGELEIDATGLVPARSKRRCG